MVKEVRVDVGVSLDITNGRGDESPCRELGRSGGTARGSRPSCSERSPG